ncbi:MAG: hypothetical protein ACRD29_24900, partial [Acidimicrobiales bacterium]
MLLLGLSVVLVLVASVLLVLGVLTSDGIGFLWGSIVLSLISGLVLLIGQRLAARRVPARAGGAAPLQMIIVADPASDPGAG